MMKIYVGEVVKKAIYAPDQHIPKVRLAKLINLSKTQFYEIINSSEMDPSYIIKLGRILGKDFRKEISGLQDYDDESDLFAEPKEGYYTKAQLERELLDLQRKYIHALEDIRQLQKELRKHESESK